MASSRISRLWRWRCAEEHTGVAVFPGRLLVAVAHGVGGDERSGIPNEHLTARTTKSFDRNRIRHARELGIAGDDHLDPLLKSQLPT